MRKLSILAPVAVLTLGAGLTLAASPVPSTPGSSAGTGGSSSGTGGSASAGAATNDWTATVRPLDAVTGELTVHRAADGTGLLTLKLDGMRREAAWSVDVDGGTVARPNETDEIAERSGADVVRSGSDSLTIRLTKREMDAFVKDQAKDGIVVSVSDGSHRSVAALPTG